MISNNSLYILVIAIRVCQCQWLACSYCQFILQWTETFNCLLKFYFSFCMIAYNFLAHKVIICSVNSWRIFKYLSDFWLYCFIFGRWTWCNFSSLKCLWKFSIHPTVWSIKIMLAMNLSTLIILVYTVAIKHHEHNLIRKMLMSSYSMKSINKEAGVGTQGRNLGDAVVSGDRGYCLVACSP